MTASLDTIAKNENRWSRLVSELKLLPYELMGLAAGGAGGYFAGSKAGELASQEFRAPKTFGFLPELGQDLQNQVYSENGALIGATVLGMAGFIATRYVVNRFRKEQD